MKKFETTDFQIEALARSDVQRALLEDVGSGDLTASLIDPHSMSKARILAREAAVICGLPWVLESVRQLDPQARVKFLVDEGQWCEANQVVVEIEGKSRALLTAERTALNFLQLLSAVATRTARFVQMTQVVPGSRTQIVDTRKTIPGLRMAQKYAVQCGGGTNHRIGLFDAVLIKENHIAAAGSIRSVLERARQTAPNAKFVEIEVENLQQLQEVLEAGAKMILLDNMSHEMLLEAVRVNAGRAVLEVSGGVSLDNVRSIASTGVDRISIGALTKDVSAVDFSMRFDD